MIFGQPVPHIRRKQKHLITPHRTITPSHTRFSQDRRHRPGWDTPFCDRLEKASIGQKVPEAGFSGFPIDLGSRQHRPMARGSARRKLRGWPNKAVRNASSMARAGVPPRTDSGGVTCPRPSTHYRRATPWCSAYHRLPSFPELLRSDHPRRITPLAQRHLQQVRRATAAGEIIHQKDPREVQLEQTSQHRHFRCLRRSRAGGRSRPAARDRGEPGAGPR
ncbi:hypothetical protein AHiyo8_49530 [Arthrobacter sp. Hiyo8]|nr:hypothetical protein AHiyo8_49530 [Arthrobacter sp. Hiyo8]